MNPKGFGRIKKRREKLESRKDWLSEINRITPWEMFRSILERLPKAERKSNAGRKPINVLLLFKLLILQQL
jgi:transposase, IS5 family